MKKVDKALSNSHRFPDVAVLGGVSEILCTLLQESLPHTIPQKAVDNALTTSILAYAK